MHITLPKIEKILKNSKIDYEIWPCDEKYADTNAFCLHYNVAPENSVNAILVQDKKKEVRYSKKSEFNEEIVKK